MKSFKKKTVALILASTISVVGSFAAGRYNNSLMRLELTAGTGNDISIVLHTKHPYTENIKPIQKEPGLYVLMLPGVLSEAPEPDFLNSTNGMISSVSTSTRPYTTNADGYTKITIRTNQYVNFIPENKVYIPSEKKEPLLITTNGAENEVSESEYKIEKSIKKDEPVRGKEYPPDMRTSQSEQPIENLVEESMSEQNNSDFADHKSDLKVDNLESSKVKTAAISNSDRMILVGSILLLLLVITLIIKKGRDKMAQVVGDDTYDLNFNDDKKKTKLDNTRKNRQIKSAIKKLDDTYNKNISLQDIKHSNQHENKIVLDTPIVIEKPQKNDVFAAEEPYESENIALEDFLNNFALEGTSDSVIIPDENSQEIGYDESDLEKVLNSESLTFSQDDIDCIGNLLRLEIYDETIKNISQYAMSNPITADINKEKILANLVSEYSISQNIVFNSDDIGILKKLLSVELDNDFVTNLKTDPHRTKQMEAEILNAEKKVVTKSEVLTLQVKNMLPNLSEALKMQEEGTLVQKATSNVIYASDGYEFKTLNVNDLLPNLSEEIGRAHEYESHPKDEIILSDSSYTVDILDVGSDMPNLEDVLNNPEKYQEPEPEVFVADEETLLNQVDNVIFKPFYDESDDTEVLNLMAEPETSSKIAQNQKDKALAEELALVFEQEDSTDDYVDFDMLTNKKDSFSEELNISNEIRSGNEELQFEDDLSLHIVENSDEELEREPVIAKRSRVKKTSLENADAEDLVKRIKLAKRIQERRKLKKERNNAESLETQSKSEKGAFTCIFEGNTYEVVDTAAISDTAGLYFAKSSIGYSVLSYNGKNLQKIKDYQNLRSTRFVARRSYSDNVNDSLKYIVKVGFEKFLVELDNNQVKFLMDL